MKEFKEYLERLEQHKNDNNNESQEKQFKQELENGIENLKRHTIQYSKQQMNWIRRLKQKLEDSNTKLFEIDTTQLSEWDRSIVRQAFEIVDLFLKNAANNVIEKSNNNEISNSHKKQWRKFVCTHCSRELNGDLEWQAHLKSKAHKQRMKMLRKAEREKQQQLSVQLETSQQLLNDQQVAQNEENAVINTVVSFESNSDFV